MTKQTNNSYDRPDLRKQIYLECRSMAGYALMQGKSVPVGAIKSIEAFEGYNAGNEASTQALRDIDLTNLVETHHVLAKLIEPAMPKTLLLLDIEREAGSLFKYLGPVKLIRSLMLVSILSLIVFVGLLATPYINSEKLSEDVLEAVGVEQIIHLVFYVSAASLGASFAALYKANKYISNGTYDPGYQGSYYIRFLLGVIAGILLAVIISQKSLGEDSLLSKGVVRPLLSILGGFSADVLYTFLNRMVETFKSLVEGNTRNVLDAKALEDKAKLTGLEVESRMKLVQILIQMQRQMGDGVDPEQIRQQINNVMQGLMLSK